MSLQTRAIALDEPPQVKFVVNEFVVSGNNPLSDDKTRSILDVFIGEHDGLEALQSAAEELERAFRNEGYAFYRVTLIPQELSAGIIRFEVSEFKIDRILVEGNEHYSEENILNSAATLSKGETPNTRVLSRAINMANTKPRKKMSLRFAESETGGAIDAKIKVKDESPDFFYASLNNTGSDETGNFRLTGGYQMTNLYDKDHNLSLNYTISPDDISAVSQFGAIYSIPYYESGTRLDIMASYSNVDSGLISNTFDVSGKGFVASVRYNKIFLQTGAYKQDIDIGLDYKLFEENVIFGATNSGVDTASMPISFTYRGARLATSGQLNFAVSLFANIPGGKNNTDADYANSRTGDDGTGTSTTTFATADWSKINYNLTYMHVLTDNWLLRFNLMGQETSEMLISGEQFGIGGIGSVRGFNEREILGDKGYQVNLELWLPTVTEYEIRPIVFYDLGHTEIIDQQPTLPVEQDPASAGAGLRWFWQNRLNLVFDVGVVTKAAGTAANGDARAHFDLFYSF